MFAVAKVEVHFFLGRSQLCSGLAAVCPCRLEQQTRITPGRISIAWQESCWCPRVATCAQHVSLSPRTQSGEPIFSGQSLEKSKYGTAETWLSFSSRGFLRTSLIPTLNLVHRYFLPRVTFLLKNFIYVYFPRLAQQYL